MTKSRVINLTHLLIFFLFGKILISGISMTDALGVLVLLTAVQVERIVRYKFPKRPDFQKEVSLLFEQVNYLKLTIEDHERDLTALKISGVRTR